MEVSTESLLLKRDQAAGLLTVSPSTLDRLVAQGHVRTVKVSPGTTRYHRDDLEALIEQARSGNTTQPSP